jgi:flavorubredoxin
LSVDNINIHTEDGYNFYSVTAEGRTVLIGGVPKRLSESYIRAARAADALVLLTSKPEFTGGLEQVLNENPDIEIYASSAGLRNIKEIVNGSINEKLIKDGSELFGIRFFIMPNLQWVDTITALYNGVLFSGELFSGFDGSAVGLKREFDNRLAVNGEFVKSALERLESEKIDAVYPALGMTCPQGSVCMSALPTELFDVYRKWCAKRQEEKTVIVYSSEYGFTKSLAERLTEKLKSELDVDIFDVSSAKTEDIISALNNAEAIIVGTNTINRNAPKKIWDAVTGIDLVNKRGTPYFVFGSFGWAGDGIKLMDKALSSMAMRQITKPVEVLFKPAEEDFAKMDKAAERIISYVCENRGK